MLLETCSEKFGFLPVGAGVYIQALVSRCYVASPIRICDTQVQLENVVIQAKAEVLEKLVVESQRAIYQAAIIAIYINIQIIVANSECPFRR